MHHERCPEARPAHYSTPEEALEAFQDAMATRPAVAAVFSQTLQAAEDAPTPKLQALFAEESPFGHEVSEETSPEA